MFKGICVWQVHITCLQGQKTTLGDVTQCCLPLFLRQCLYSTWNFPGRLGWLTSESQGWSAYLWYSRAVITGLHHHGFWNVNPVLYWQPSPPGPRPPWLPLLPSSISPSTCLNKVLYKEATRSTLSHHSQIQWKLNNMNEMARSGHWTMTGGHDPWDGKSR